MGYLYTNPGIVFTGEAQATAVGTSGYTVINQIEGLKPGAYLIIVNVTFTATGTGSLGINVLDCVEDGTSYETVCNTRTTLDAGGGGIAVGIAEFSSGGRHKIVARATQTSGSSKTLNINSLKAIRLRGAPYLDLLTGN